MTMVTFRLSVNCVWPGIQHAGIKQKKIQTLQKHKYHGERKLLSINEKKIEPRFFARQDILKFDYNIQQDLALLLADRH